MDAYLKRFVVYCPNIDSEVNQEVSFRIVDGKREFYTTCTGIKEICLNCPIVQCDSSKIVD
ncbi:hypothetical protein [Metabacillus fastidiosus]|uniref:hypothetical protein n=1 Tax=Metabacillus fastidiosus TaxID=1458 RepID=UPI0008247B1A|nr:hypothetical protein [Metabacillus fastidiosus]MED4462550.1 hypothetical protein [Metabacillus fastidiosus]